MEKGHSRSPRKTWVVITTINPPTTAVEFVSRLCAENGWSAVVVGDRKTPKGWSIANIDYLSIEEQKDRFGSFSDAVPFNHYCRKNLGYLYAIGKGADCILETDDDNIPYADFGSALNPFVEGDTLEGPGWVNVYKHFSKALIWPRGLPLDDIHTAGKTRPGTEPRYCPIQQYLADADPDVDAIYRLIFRDPVDFDKSAPSLVLNRDCWVPFNSQNTVFFTEAFPLLYLPCHVSFRMTDIWRSFVAQAALWAGGYHVAFHTSTVKQIRNEHNLMKDFEQEIVGYRHNRDIGRLLSGCLEKLPPITEGRLADAALELWKTLAEAAHIPAQEMKLIETWFSSLPAPRP